MSQPCRSCGAPLTTVFADLGMSPIANAFRPIAQAGAPETFYPLCAWVCDACKLVQIADVAGREAHFHEDYAYFSSFSSTWLDHARDYADMATQRFGLGPRSLVIEVASNDGYLLRHFVERQVPALGIDPAANCARAAEKQGVETRVAFFGEALARDLKAEGRTADLIVANNVLAHVPDLHDFVAGLAIVLAPEGTITIEFPHLLATMRQGQFDTIYHEHFSYFSAQALFPLLARHGLEVVDVDRLATHGGSLRLYVRHAAAGGAPSAAVAELVAEEKAAGLDTLTPYMAFADRVQAIRRDLVALLTGLRAEGCSIAGYGAPAKATTLLNFCGLGPEVIAFTVDANPAKQDRLIPGVNIPILAPDALAERQPDYVVILPWNVADEIIAAWSRIGQWGGRFIVPGADLRVVEPI